MSQRTLLDGVLRCVHCDHPIRYNGTVYVHHRPFKDAGGYAETHWCTVSPSLITYAEPATSEAREANTMTQVWVCHCIYEPPCGVFATEQAAWTHFNSCQNCAMIYLYSGDGNMSQMEIAYVPDTWSKDGLRADDDCGGKVRWVNEYTGRKSNPMVPAEASKSQEVDHGGSGVEGGQAP